MFHDALMQLQKCGAMLLLGGAMVMPWLGWCDHGLKHLWIMATLRQMTPTEAQLVRLAVASSRDSGCKLCCMGKARLQGAEPFMHSMVHGGRHAGLGFG